MTNKKITKSKVKMAGLVAAASEAAPSLKDRIRHAQEMAASHPTAHESPTSIPAAAEVLGTNEGRFEVVDIDLIDENPFNARRIYRTERVIELAASIGAKGQDTPGTATIRNGRYVLASGHYRRKAIKHLNLRTMKLMVYEGLTDIELFEFSFRENAEREGQSALDNALSWRENLDNKLFSNESELAASTGFQLPYINKTLRILDLSEPVLEVIKENPAAFTITPLYELVLYEEVAGSERALEMVNLMKSGDISRREISAARENLATSKKVRQQRKTSRAYKINRGGQNIGTIKVWDTGRVMLDVVLEEGAERDQTVAELKSKFGLQGVE